MLDPVSVVHLPHLGTAELDHLVDAGHVHLLAVDLATRELKAAIHALVGDSEVGRRCERVGHLGRGLEV